MLAEAWKWVLAPAQEPKTNGGLTELFWEEKSILSSSQNPVDSIFKVLEENELVIPKWAPIHLKKVLQSWFWKPGQPDASVMDVWKACCSYPYLPRLLDSTVLQDTIAAGVVTTDFFGYTNGKDGEKYLGLIFGKGGSIYIDQSSLLIEPETAMAFLTVQETVTGGLPITGDIFSGAGQTPKVGMVASPIATYQTSGVMKRFHGSVALDPISMGLDAAKIAEEIVQHFTSQIGTSVSITLEIEANIPVGIKDGIRRAIQRERPDAEVQDCRV